MNTSTLQIRIDSKIKMAAQKTLSDLGLDISSATKIFLKQVISTKSIPFEIRTENGFTPKQEDKMLKEIEWAKKHGKRYKTVSAMLKSIK